MVIRKKKKNERTEGKKRRKWEITRESWIERAVKYILSIQDVGRGKVSRGSRKFVRSCRNSLGSRKRHGHETNTNTVLSLSLPVRDVFAWINAGELYRSAVRSLPCVVTGQTCLPIVPCIGPPLYTRATDTESVYARPYTPPSRKEGPRPSSSFRVCGNTKREVEIEYFDTDTASARLNLGFVLDLRVTCSSLRVDLFPYFVQVGCFSRLILAWTRKKFGIQRVYLEFVSNELSLEAG